MKLVLNSPKEWFPSPLAEGIDGSPWLHSKAHAVFQAPSHVIATLFTTRASQPFSPQIHVLFLTPLFSSPALEPCSCSLLPHCSPPAVFFFSCPVCFFLSLLCTLPGASGYFLFSTYNKTLPLTILWNSHVGSFFTAPLECSILAPLVKPILAALLKSLNS